MRKPSIIYSLLIFVLLSIIARAQTQTIQVTGPSQTSGPVTITLEINAPTTCSVSMLPATLTIDTNNTQQFTATTTGCSPSTVFYQVNGVTGGNATVGTITVGGLYTAPAAVPTPATVTVTAVSNADNTKIGSSSVTIVTPPPPCSVSIVPTSASVLVNGTQQFTDTTVGCTPSTVTWQVNGLTGGNSTTGTVSNTGLYTAPASVPTPNTVNVCAVSNQSGAISACASVVLSAPAVCSVSITPIGGVTPIVVNVLVGATQQFTAQVTNCSPSTVTWSVNGINGGNSTIGTVSSTGLYTAPATVPSPNTVTVTVTSNADATKNSSATVNIITSSSSIMDSNCLQGNVPTWGTADHVATLPKTCYNTDPSVIKSNPSGTTRTATVATLSTVWNASSCGDVIELAAGSSGTGNITLSSKNCPGPYYTVIRTSGYASLPPYGTFLTPCYAGVASLPGRPNFNCSSTTNVMAQLVTNNTQSVITLGTNTKYLELKGLEVTRTSASGFVFRLINISNGGIDHIVLDDVWCHGTETGDETNSCFGLSAANYVGVIDSFMNDFICLQNGACTDAHAIGGGINQTAGCNDNTYKIKHNFLEGAAQTILLGGSGAACTPSDIEIADNIMWKPQTWNPSSPTFNGGYVVSGVTRFVFVKNLFELKNAQRVLFENNYMANVWAGFSQPGTAILLTPKNQAAGKGNICPTCFVANVTLRYNWIDFSCSATTMANASSDNGGYAAGGFNYSHHDNLYTNQYYNTAYKCGGNIVTAQRLTNPGAPSNDILNNVYDQHNTYVPSPTPISRFNGIWGISGNTIASGLNMTNIDLRNNLLTGSSTTGISNPSDGCSKSTNNCACNQSTPTAILNACIVGYQFGGTAIIGFPGGTLFSFPGTNCTSETSFANAFVNYNNGIFLPGGDFHLKNTSPCHNTATDGTDPGADITGLVSKISNIYHF